jgi:hypothetical protein
MNAFVHKARGKRGGFVKFMPSAGHRSQERRRAAGNAAIAAILACLLFGTGAVLRFLFSR